MLGENKGTFHVQFTKDKNMILQFCNLTIRGTGEKTSEKICVHFCVDAVKHSSMSEAISQ